MINRFTVGLVRYGLFTLSIISLFFGILVLIIMFNQRDPFLFIYTVILIPGSLFMLLGSMVAEYFGRKAGLYDDELTD